MKENKIYKVVGSLSSSDVGIKFKVIEINVTEHSKCYDTFDGKRYRKSKLNKVDSILTNNITSNSGFIGYFVMCTENDINASKELISSKITNRVNELKTAIDLLYNNLNEN